MLANRSPMPTLHFIHNCIFGHVELNEQTSKDDSHPPPLFMIILGYLKNIFWIFLKRVFYIFFWKKKYYYVKVGILSHAPLSPKGESISFILRHIPHTKAPSTRLRNNLNFSAKLANTISLKNQPFFFNVVVDPICASAYQPIKPKARFITLCFEQQVNINYEDTFALVAKWSIIYDMVTLATNYDWDIVHMDIKTTFLNEDLKEDVYHI